MYKIFYELLFSAAIHLVAQVPVTFEKTYGGKDDDLAKAVIETSYGRLIVGAKKSDLSRDSNARVLKVGFDGRMK